MPKKRSIMPLVLLFCVLGCSRNHPKSDHLSEGTQIGDPTFLSLLFGFDMFDSNFQCGYPEEVFGQSSSYIMSTEEQIYQADLYLDPQDCTLENIRSTWLDDPQLRIHSSPNNRTITEDAYPDDNIISVYGAHFQGGQEIFEKLEDVPFELDDFGSSLSSGFVTKHSSTQGIYNFLKLSEQQQGQVYFLLKWTNKGKPFEYRTNMVHIYTP